MPTCPHCHQQIKMGQSRLTDSEISKLPIGNQNTEDRPTLIEWQAVKGAAVYYGVSNWVEKVDTSLSYEENIDLMRRYGTDPDASGGRTVKEMAAREHSNMRWRQQR